MRNSIRAGKACLMFLCAFLLLPVSGRACDICGCGLGNSYIGVLPEFNDHVIGVRYHYQTLRSHIGAGGKVSYLTTDETFRTLDLWGGFNISDRFRVFASVPFISSTSANKTAMHTGSGLGDVSAVGYYALVKTRDVVNGDQLLVQSLWIGLGVKAPTGELERPQSSVQESAIPLFQSGTKSTDFTINGMYDLRLQDGGLSTTCHYKLTTKNAYDYSYGNELMVSLQGYYKIRMFDLLTTAPNIGILYEQAAQDDDAGVVVDHSGGHVLLAAIGAEFTTDRFAFGGSLQVPITQELANGSVQANSRFMTHVAVKF